MSSPNDEEVHNSPDVDKEITLTELTPTQISSSPLHSTREATVNRKYEERTTKSEERTLNSDFRPSTEFDEMRRATSVDNSSKNNSELTAVFFNKLVAKVSTNESLNHEPVDTEINSTSSLDTKNVDLGASTKSLTTQNVEMTASTTSLDVDNNCVAESQKLSEVFRSNTSLENVDCRQSKFSEMSRSNVSLESTASHVATANKYASCFSISRIKAHNFDNEEGLKTLSPLGPEVTVNRLYDGKW